MESDWYIGETPERMIPEEGGRCAEWGWNFILAPNESC